MPAVEVVVRPRPAPDALLAPLHGVLDLVVDGVNITARVGQGHAYATLAELSHAVAALARGKRSRATVQLCTDGQVWELGLEVDGDDVLATLFRGGRCPEVVIHERRAGMAELCRALADAIDHSPVATAPGAAASALHAARRALAGLPEVPVLPRRRTATAAVRPASDRFGLVAGGQFRTADGTACATEDEPQLERADLHALLVRGELGLAARGRLVHVPGIYLFLAAEQLLLLADEVLEACSAGRPLFRRIVAGGARFGIRRGPSDDTLSVTIGPVGEGSDSNRTFPEIAAHELARAIVQFARSLVETFVAYDRSQAKNLRLRALLRSASNIEERLLDLEANDARTNPEPEVYRSFGLPRRRSQSRGVWEHGAKMRFLPRWVATIPNIDLSATFLCGDKLVVGAARELACLHRNSGALLWHRTAPRAVSVVTPAGLVRLNQNGALSLYQLESGEIEFTTELEPRPGRGASGAVVHAPGLPKLIVVAEGDRAITAVDLVTGDVRWRFSARRPSQFRLRRAGRLLLVSGGDAALVALDVVSGDVVWRFRDRFPFSGELVVDRDSAFAVVSGHGGPSHLYHLELWSGEMRWSCELDERPAPGQAPLVTPRHVAVPTRDRQGVGVLAFDRATGQPAFSHEPGLCAPLTSWLAVDDALIANGSTGSLVCLDSASGSIRYQHVFPRHVDADQPRRLEPVLRSGALFVPQHQVHVVRPRDGEVLGTVPSDLIPDLVRVDERCDVYIAEESGHVAAFGAAPKLTLVKG